MRTRIALILLGLATVASAEPDAGDGAFTVRLGLVNGHLQEVFFGCAPQGTDGYDRGLDDLAPPPGLGTGYTALIPPVGNMPPFYKDIRSLAGEATWRLMVRVHEGKPVEVSWDAATLPDARRFTVTHGEQVHDMREVGRVELTRNGTVVIAAKRHAEKAAPVADEKNDEPPAAAAAE